ncbi:MAG: gliding motility-associated C-terminal domain-containing protein [Flavobacteriales bacterium]|nr:gliding motility-associated C-terminal domain-containing protein [Flavobacteriales bacterium]
MLLGTAQVCDPAGNLFLVSNYDGGIVTINVDEDIPNLVIGISTYEPVQVTITGPFATNVVQVLYAGMNSSQNNNNCGQGNFTTSIVGVNPGIITINPPMQPPQVGYTPAHGNGTGSWGGVVIGAAGGCDTTVNTGGVNTPDELVFHFEDQTGASLYAHYTQYGCWQNDVIDLSEGGTCCIDPTVPVVAGCDPNGNVLIYSNYDGGTLTINVDQDIPDLRIGICTYEAVQVNIIGPFAANVTEVIYAGFDGNNAPCGTNPPTTTINGVPPGIVTQYSQTLGNIAIANFLGEPLAPGFPPLVNCITGAEGECSTSNSGGGNSAPQIAQFFLAEFGPGATLFAHQVQYDCFTGTFNVSDGGNCCLLETGTPPNPIYSGNATFDFIPWTDSLLCSGSITIDLSFYPVLFQPPTYPGYVWSDGTTGSIITITEPGTYSFIVGDYCHYADGNWLTDTVVVLPCCSIGGVDTATTAISCSDASDGTITVTPLGNGTYNYLWNTLPPQSAPTIGGLDGGTYSVVVDDGAGCDTTLTFTLIAPEPILIELNGDTEVCIGETTSVSAIVQGGSGVLDLDWGPLGNGPDVLFTPTDTTVVGLVVTDANGCTATAQLQVNASLCCPTWNIDAQVEGPSCADSDDGSIQLDVSSSEPLSFTWSTAPIQTNATASDLQAGTYIVLIANATGCDSSLTFTVEAPDALSMDVSATTPLCANAGGTAIAEATGGTGAYTYVWNTGASGASIDLVLANTTTLVATATDANGCSASGTFLVVVDQPPAATFTSSADTVCVGVLLEFTSTSVGADSLRWSLGSGGSSTDTVAVAAFATSGQEVITLVAFGTNGCASVPATDTVLVAPFPQLELMGEQEPCTRTIDVGVLAQGATTCSLWLDGALISTDCVVQLELTRVDEGDRMLTLSASNAAGCADTATTVVRVADPVGLFVPNVFTPDGNTINDVFSVAVGTSSQGAMMRIFNRWGQEVTSTTDLAAGWDGTVGGEPVPDGVYIYLISAPDPCASGELRELRGHVTVLR